MTPFDERFADRVREAFDAYDEPVDGAALDRMRAALGHPDARPPAADRGPVAGRQVRRRWVLVAVLVALAAVGGVWLRAVQTDPGPAVATVPADGSARAVRDAQPSVAPRSEAPRAAAPAPNGRPTPGNPVALGDPTAPDAGPPVRAGTAVARSTADPGPLVIADGSARPGTPSETLPSGADEGRTPPLGAVPPSSPPASGDPARPDVASLPSSVLGPGRRAEPLPAVSVPVGPAAGLAPGLRVVVAATSAFSDGELAVGIGLSAGVSRDWRVGRGVSVSGGAVAAYTRLTLDDLSTSQRFSGGSDPVDVVTESTLTTVAIEVPLDMALDVATVAGGRLGVSVGLTSAVYLSQTFEDRGRTVTVLSSTPFAGRETVGPLGRLDLARQLNLGVRFTPAGRALAADVYARLPLAGLTSRDIDLTTVGLRLRYALP